VSRHRLFVANGVFPRFSSTPARYRNWTSRAPYVAGLVRASGADCATFGELGRSECATLARFLPGWQYDRAQGGAQEGLNSVWSKTAVWDQPEAGVHDWNLPSGGQWQRTLILAKITERADPTAFVSLGAYHETLGNDAGMAYVVAMIARIGERRVILGGDFKRTDDDDDVIVMKRAGFVFHERVDATPMTVITQHAVTVSGVDHVRDTRAFDHEHLIVDFSIKGKDPEA
jgi:hypothetical protein